MLRRCELVFLGLLIVAVCGSGLPAAAKSRDIPERERREPPDIPEGELRTINCPERKPAPKGNDPKEKDPKRNEPKAKDPKGKDSKEKDPEAKDPKAKDREAKNTKEKDREAKDPKGKGNPKDTVACPEPMPPPSSSSPGFHPLDQRMVGNMAEVGYGPVPGCSQEVHDLYVTLGPDGKPYRTWHALWHPKVHGQLVRWMPTWEEVSAGKYDPECYFAHEHGQPPLALAEPRSGAPLPAFGYGAVVDGRPQIEPHPGFKVFTYLAGGRSGWRTNAAFKLNPDWDMEVMIHQGSPSLHLPEAPVSTRVTQRFHELSFWTRDGEGRVTHVIKISDTGTASFRGYSEGGGRVIATAKEPLEEVWAFEGGVGDVFNLTFPAAILNPMNHFVVVGAAPPTDLTSVTSANFASSSNRFGGWSIDTLDSLGCFGGSPAPTQCATWPFGDHRVSPDGFLGTVRSLAGMSFNWNNTTGQEMFCTDARGTIHNVGPCPEGNPRLLLQLVAPIVLSRGATGPDQSWTNVITTDHDEYRAFPVMTDDPDQPWGPGKAGRCKPADSPKSYSDCLPRIPQDFMLGN
jgi:hypothetical protein